MKSVNVEHMSTLIPVIADGLIWLTVLASVQLALRHPLNTGPSADLARKFADELAEKLLVEGVLTVEGMAEIMRGSRVVVEVGG